MDLDDFIITVFCLIDDLLPEVIEGRLRARGPAPILADSEVLTMDVVGEFLGIDQDKALVRYVQRHWSHLFPAITRVHRTTVVRQAANLWAVKERLWLALLPRIPYDPTFAIVDSFPLPVCHFARAPRCRRFRGDARYGKDVIARQTFYGFRVHVRLCWPGVITRVSLTPANTHELTVVPELTEQTQGVLLGDRNYWSPRLKDELAGQGIELLAQFSHRSRDPWPHWSALLGRVRYRIDTVFGQLVGRCHVKQIWAKDSWHLWSRLLRKVLLHTLAVLLNLELDQPPLQFDHLVV